MSLQDLLKKILADSDAEIKKSQAKTDQQKDEIAAEFVKKEKQQLSVLEKKTEKALASVDEKIQLMARRANAKSLLAAKQKVIKQALEQFLKHLEKADTTLYGKILESLFSRVQETSGKVYAPSDRLDITKKHAKHDFEVVADNKIKAGFILKTGDSEIDNTFHSLVFSEFREEFTMYFSQQLKLV